MGFNDGRPEEGDICPKCKKGKIAFGTNWINKIEPDQEPFGSGVLETIPDCEEIELDDRIYVMVDACHNCGHIIRAWLEVGYWDKKKLTEVKEPIPPTDKSVGILGTIL